ncbi:tRNA (adenosine(37)-N6)-dimethylallyltransferase MiaA [bacterium]|nr:MAG: tRNA (adenosine(37)-N6)-dimethylallyltransferase MiaA [bacterium]
MGGPRGICPVIVGPTAVGKTALVTSLAERLPLEVISLDSRQIYHGLRIGTAQPTAEELSICPHHLVDFVDPDDSYDAQRYRRDFCGIHAGIVGRGGVPLLVGGAGMYLTAVREGFMAVPGQTPERLQEVRAELAPLTDAEIRLRLADADPDSHARLHANDRQRSQRALEVYLLSGRSMTELQAAQVDDPALGLEFPVFVLERPVKELDARILRRTETMLQQGWIDETAEALTRHRSDGPGLRSIGYRDIVRHLQGDLARDDLTPAVVRATRQYAKRQRTWFRKVAGVGRGNPDDPALAVAIGEALAPR